MDIGSGLRLGMVIFKFICLFVPSQVILHTNPTEPAMREEIFGPVLSIYECKLSQLKMAILMATLPAFTPRPER